jgi:hypothetical protein
VVLGIWSRGGMGLCPGTGVLDRLLGREALAWCECGGGGRQKAQHLQKVKSCKGVCSLGKGKTLSGDRINGEGSWGAPSAGL